MAVDLAGRVRDIVELVPPDASAASSDQGENIIATFHHPCTLSRGQGLAAAPGDILRALPGLEYRELPEADWCCYRELPEADWCCGGAAYPLSDHDPSHRVLDRKLDNVARTGANLLVTSCPACIVQLIRGVRRRRLPVRVCHISEVVSGRRE